MFVFSKFSHLFKDENCYSWIAHVRNFHCKMFPPQTKIVTRTSRFHGAFSLDEISLKPGALSHLSFLAKDNIFGPPQGAWFTMMEDELN